MNDLVPELRLKSILHYLADSNAIVTIQQIADEIGVSRRTILREIPEVQEWLRKNQFTLVKRPGQGILLEGDEGTRLRLKEMLSGNMSVIVNIPKDRQKMLLVELLQKKEPSKLYYFTSKLGVSASTISNDMDKVEGWLNKYSLTLVRKTGLGVYITGEEKNFRRAMISLLYENLSEEELIQIIKDTVPNRRIKANVLQVNVRNRLLNLIDRNSIEKIEAIVYGLEKSLTYRLAESACIGLMVHLALAVQRIKNNEKIAIDPGLLSELKGINEFVFASEIAGKVAAEFDIEVPIDEIGYITMHLKGARAYNGTVRENDSLTKQELFQIAWDMIDTVEREFGIELKKNEKLLYDLVCHLDPALRRLELNLDIRNPLLEQLKQLFPEVYRISEIASEVLKQHVGKEIPESEIGFIAMHFGAAIEKSKPGIKRQYKVIVACPSGIGSSRLLSARLEKEFEDIEIADTVSTYEVTDKLIAEKHADLVISTLPIEDCPVKNICVNPLLLEEDKLLIHQALRQNGYSDKKTDMSSVSVDHLKSNITHVVNYSSFVSEILENHKILVNPNMKSEVQFITDIPGLFSEDAEDRRLIAKQLSDKNGLRLAEDCVMLSCYLESRTQNTLLLCRVNKELLMKYCGRNAEMAIVLLMPEAKRMTYQNIVRDFYLFISSHTNMKKLLKSASEEEISKKLYELLSELYMTKLYEWRTQLHA